MSSSNSGPAAPPLGLNATPSSERTHIGFFGRRNAGKSSLVNAIAGQDVAIVSETKGTTTDPVSKAMELQPLGPVVLIDTPGYDDDDARLGQLRVCRAEGVLAKADIAVLVVDAREGLVQADREILASIEARKIPHLLVYTHADLLPANQRYAHTERTPSGERAPLYVSSTVGEGIQAVRDALGALAPAGEDVPIVRDLLNPGDVVILVVPIDEAAPKGRLILPQVQTLREVLDAGAIGLAVKDTELEEALAKLPEPPALVITDSQAFGRVAALVPESVPLTSFSILLARHKGFLAEAVEGVAALAHVGEGSRVLVAEGCTHDRTCNDIATVKIPQWLRESSGGAVGIETATGFSFPENLEGVEAVLHCGGCMLTARDMARRGDIAREAGVPLTNYGLAIAQMHGVLKRSLGIFPELQAKLS